MQIFDSKAHSDSAVNELSARLPNEYRVEFELLLQQLPDMSPYDLLGMSKYDPRTNDFGKIAKQQGKDLLEFISANFTKSSHNKLKSDDPGVGVYASSSLNRKELNRVVTQAVMTLSETEKRKRYDRDAGVELARSMTDKDPYSVLGIERSMLENLGSARETAVENCKLRRLMQLQLASELALAESIALESPDTVHQHLYLQGDRRQLSDDELSSARKRVSQAAARLLSSAASKVETKPESPVEDTWEHFRLAGDKFLEGIRHVANGFIAGVERTIPKAEQAIDNLSALLKRVEDELIKRL